MTNKEIKKEKENGEEMSRSQKIKSRARKTIPDPKISKKKKKYVLDTSAIINQFIPEFVEKGLRGDLIIPNAVMAEMEKLANTGKEPGFRGLEEVKKFRDEKNIKVKFKGKRPTKMQRNYAKSGEIDAMIRNLALKSNATLITADLVQAKSAQAYGLEVIYKRPKPIKQKRKTKKRKEGLLKRIYKKIFA